MLSLRHGAAALFFALLPLSSFAATAKLEIVAPATANTNQAIDVTVRAVDANGKTATDYLGTIFFTVKGDESAVVPNADDGYTFIDKDQGVKIFSKGITFKKAGKLEIVVVDLENEKIEGTATLTVSEGSATTATGEKVTVVSPEPNMSVSEKKLAFVGTTRANSMVIAYLNGAKFADNQTDANGNFKFDITNLKDGENTLRVDVLNGSDAVIGTSGPIAVKVVGGGAALKSATIQEGTGALAGTPVTLLVVSEPKLTEVLATMSGQVYPLAEETANPGVYSSKIAAPAQSGSYTIDVSLKNALGVVTKTAAAATLTVVQPVLSLSGITVADKKATYVFSLQPDVKEVASFALQYSTGFEADLSLSGAAKTDAKAKILSGSEYIWYVDNLAYAKYITKVVALNASGAEIPNLAVTGAFETVAPLTAAPEAPKQCTVGSVEDIQTTVDTKLTKSVLSWKALSGAVSYNIYKEDASGQPVFVENTKETSYTVYLTGKKVAYEKFSVKGVCEDANGKNESPEFKQMVKVQTGPEVVLFIIAVAISGAWFVTRFVFVRK